MICDPEIWQVAMGIATTWIFGDQEDERTHVAEKNTNKKRWCKVRESSQNAFIFEESPFHGKSSCKCIGSECRVKSLGRDVFCVWIWWDFEIEWTCQIARKCHCLQRSHWSLWGRSPMATGWHCHVLNGDWRCWINMSAEWTWSSVTFVV